MPALGFYCVCRKAVDSLKDTPRAVHCNASAEREQDGDDDVNRNRVTSCCHTHTPHAEGREMLVLHWIHVVVSRLNDLREQVS